MGKKRKVGGKPSGRDQPIEVANDSARLRINTFEDVADSEDEFHVNRDKVLLDEAPAQKKQRRMHEEGESGHFRGESAARILTSLQSKFWSLRTKKSLLRATTSHPRLKTTSSTMGRPLRQRSMLSTTKDRENRYRIRTMRNSQRQ